MQASKVICDDTSHVGPAAQVVLYSYRAISCSISQLNYFLDDANQKITEIEYNYNHFIDHLNDNYTQFIKSSGNVLSSDTILQIQNHISDIRNKVSTVHEYFVKTEMLLGWSQQTFISTVDDVISASYKTSIKSLEKSIQDGKNCVTDIFSEVKYLFDLLYDRLLTCTSRLIEVNGIKTQFSYAFQVAIFKLMDLQSCLLPGQPANCIITVRFVC